MLLRTVLLATSPSEAQPIYMSVAGVQLDKDYLHGVATITLKG